MNVPGSPPVAGLGFRSWNWNEKAGLLATTSSTAFNKNMETDLERRCILRIELRSALLTDLLKKSNGGVVVSVRLKSGSMRTQICVAEPSRQLIPIRFPT